MSQITTHILDTSQGKPAENVPVSLYHKQESHWSELGSGLTNSDGRVADLLPQNTLLKEGIYKLLFETRPYYEDQQIPSFYPHIEIVFQIGDDGQHYHVPLLLNPYGYSTYRGS